MLYTNHVLHNDIVGNTKKDKKLSCQSQRDRVILGDIEYFAKSLKSFEMAFLRKAYVMYNVLSGLAACGRLGVAARPAVFCLSRVAARDAARVDVRDDSQSSVSSGQRRTRLNLSV